jgi:hypothetical protein
MSGIDMRYALSVLGGHEYCKSLTTIATPHEGCRLSDIINDRRDYSIAQLQRPLEFIGLTQDSIKEFRTTNIQAFNQIAPPHHEINVNIYYNVFCVYGVCVFSIIQ